MSQDLADHGLRIDRCTEGVEVKKIEDFPCREVGATADGMALKAKQEKEKEEKLMNKTGESK